MKKTIGIALASAVIALALDFMAWTVSGSSDLFRVIFDGRWIKVF